jgi:phage gp29-like protein
MKLFGYELKRASKPDASRGGRITSPSATDFGWYGTKLTPAQVRSLLSGMRAGSFTDGHDLFSEMQDTWHTLAKNLQQLREAVATVRYAVAPYTAEGEEASADALAKAATCRQAMGAFYPEPASDENGFEDFIYDLTDALILGVNVQEILWHRENGLILPRATAWVHPNQYGLGDDGRLGLSADASTNVIYKNTRKLTVEPFPTDKFIVAAYKTRSGARTVGGLLRPLAKWWCAAQFGYDWVLRNAELFGQAIRDIEYDPNIKPEDLAELKAMAANMGNSAWIARPTGTKLTLVEASKTGNASPQAELLDRADRACDLMILWQTLTSSTGPSGGGSLALGQVHMGVLESRKQNIARWAANVISYQLFPAICRLNHGDADECPILAPDHTKAEDPKAKAERLAICKNIVPLPKTWAYEQLGVPMPVEGEEVIAPSAPPSPFGFPSGLPLPAKDGTPARPPLKAYDPDQPRDEQGQWTEGTDYTLAPKTVEKNGDYGWEATLTKDGRKFHSYEKQQAVEQARTALDEDRRSHASRNQSEKKSPANNLPPHLQKALEKWEEKKKKLGFTITDVTPTGYGPSFNATDTAPSSATDPRSLSTDHLQSLAPAVITDTDAPAAPLQGRDESPTRPSTPPRPSAADDLRAATTAALAAARANDLKPLADRLAVLDAITDDAAMLAEMKNLSKEWPALLKQVNAKTATAQALAESMTAEFFNGLSAPTSLTAKNAKPDSYTPTSGMKEAAKRALAWRAEFNRGGTEIGVARARSILNDNLPADTVMRMVSFFARHEVNKQATGFNSGEEGFPSAGRIAWDLWGGDAGKAWANKIAAQLEGED